ncbi:hypothetical protein T4B_6870 [Trichinella pseudospiralis]|uniref:Uncharacterized protein n=1 Tax=Trichinella pseudospiralis TaxID=6337 RepID=A0A0V1IPG1_TRIPS|nr:hypothetical protein T4B_6870 [Trichinella pseudospiralis]
MRINKKKTPLAVCLWKKANKTEIIRALPYELVGSLKRRPLCKEKERAHDSKEIGCFPHRYSSTDNVEQPLSSALIFLSYGAISASQAVQTEASLISHCFFNQPTPTLLVDHFPFNSTHPTSSGISGESLVDLRIRGCNADVDVPESQGKEKSILFQLINSRWNKKAASSPCTAD